MPSRLVLALLATAGLLAACGSPSASGGSPTASAVAPWTIVSCDAQTAPYGADAADGTDGTDQVKVTDVKSIPYVSIAAGAQAPTDLQVVDIIPGTGETVAAGGSVAVNYCGIGLQTMSLFDSSYGRGAPATFSLDQVIPGFGQGLVGMKTGGQRLIVIPGALAYGANPPQGSGIMADEALIFVVDMVATQ